MPLINDHMLESLIEGGTHKDFCFNHLARLSVIENLIAVRMHTKCRHVLAQRIHLEMVVGCAVTQGSCTTTNLAEDRLHQLCNGHARRNCVRVHDEVRTQTPCSERHVFFVQQHAHRALLTMPRRKFIAYLRDTFGHHTNLDKRISIRILVLPDPVDTARLGILVRGRHVAIRIPCRIVAQIGNLANDHIILLQDRVQDRNTILTDCVITCILELAGIVLVRFHELFLTTRGHIAVLLILVHGVVETAKQPAIDCTAVHDDRIFLVVPSITGNGNNGIHSKGHGVHFEKVHASCLHNGAGQGAQNVCILVETLGKVCGVRAHGLLAHCRLIGVSRRLIVVRKRNRACHVSQQKRRMDLVVRMGRHALTRHGNAQGLRLGCINVLDARTHPLRPVIHILGRRTLSYTKHGTNYTTAIRLN